MTIKVDDPRIGTFTWELPPDLAEKWTLKSAEMPEGTEERLKKFIEDTIVDLLIVTCDALEFTPATPALLEALFHNIDRLMNEAGDIVLIVENIDKISRLIKDKDKDRDKDSESEDLSEDPDMKEIEGYLNEDEDGEKDDDGDDRKDDSPSQDNKPA